MRRVAIRCYICDREDDLITYDKVRKEFVPCAVCQSIIEETIEEYDKDTVDYEI